MKLWDKGKPVNKKIEDFTVGRDRELDAELAEFDILGSMAHIIMLELEVFSSVRNWICSLLS